MEKTYKAVCLNLDKKLKGEMDAVRNNVLKPYENQREFVEKSIKLRMRLVRAAKNGK